MDVSYYTKLFLEVVGFPIAAFCFILPYIYNRFIYYIPTWDHKYIHSQYMKAVISAGAVALCQMIDLKEKLAWNEIDFLFGLCHFGVYGQ